MQLETKRLILRDVKKGDEDSIRENINTLKVSRYLTEVPFPYTKKNATWFVNYCLEDLKKNPREKFEFGITLKKNSFDFNFKYPVGELVGAIALRTKKFEGTATIGYWLGVKYHRKGIMTEALAKVIDFAFNELKLRKINICHESLNKASEGLIRKAGFKLEGCQIKQGKIKSTGKIYDRCIYGMLKSEWARNKKRLLKK